MNKLKICYLTYQTFPAETANSLQTIKNIDKLIKNNVEVNLIYPRRDINCSDSIDKIKEFYNIESDFKIKIYEHNYPFGNWKKFIKISFHISHFLWARKTVAKISKDLKKYDLFFTRSEWIYYFLLKRGIKVLLECHQRSKIRDFIIRMNYKKTNSYLIFLNSLLMKKILKNNKNSNTLVLHNAVDLNEFHQPVRKLDQLIFVGSLNRFGKDRGLYELIEGFSKSKFSKSNKFLIVGGPNSKIEEYQEFIKKNSFSSNIEFTGRLTRKETIELICNSKFGILTNSSENLHSRLYTSPLKYFEYLAGKLLVLATDFESHRSLPYSEKIIYFKERDVQDITNTFDSLKIENQIESINYEKISLDYRAKSIIDFIK